MIPDILLLLAIVSGFLAGLLIGLAVWHRTRSAFQLEREEFFTLPKSGLVLYRGSRAPGGWFGVTDVLAPAGYIYIERGEEGIL
ncbi:hypothetical protein LCGC14_2342460 [marine sediment metagenome]|uniref:Uncharacterized protein n=1 Tax=marine sediment metagenome TaxID=412755 RepID=A0A0F9CBK8_9ZZZZ